MLKTILIIHLVAKTLSYKKYHIKNPTKNFNIDF